MYYNLLFIDSPGRGRGDLVSPTSTVVTHEQTVLISDMYNDRISEFSLDDGRFTRHVLKRKDGINSPQCISLDGKLLWVSYDVTASLDSDKNIQCYKLYA